MSFNLIDIIFKIIDKILEKIKLGNSFLAFGGVGLLLSVYINHTDYINHTENENELYIKLFLLMFIFGGVFRLFNIMKPVFFPVNFKNKSNELLHTKITKYQEEKKSFNKSNQCKYREILSVEERASFVDSDRSRYKACCWFLAWIILLILFTYLADKHISIF